MDDGNVVVYFDDVHTVRTLAISKEVLRKFLDEPEATGVMVGLTVPADQDTCDAMHEKFLDNVGRVTSKVKDA